MPKVLSTSFEVLVFLVECQATCFKNSSYIFSKSGRDWNNSRRVCNDQGFDLVSIETEEEWQFISNEIQKRGTWNASAWHIGLWKIGGVWTWLSGEQLNISKWRDSEPDGNDDYAEISRNRGLFNGISRNDKMPIFARFPEVRSHSNHKVYYVLKHYSLPLMSGKLLLLLKSENIVHRICSAHLTCTCER